jgi:hypothetical protein
VGVCSFCCSCRWLVTSMLLQFGSEVQRRCEPDGPVLATKVDLTNLQRLKGALPCMLLQCNGP